MSTPIECQQVQIPDRYIEHFLRFFQERNIIARAYGFPGNGIATLVVPASAYVPSVDYVLSCSVRKDTES